MVEVVWTKRAESQFERTIRYIKEDQGTAYAKIVRDRILAETKRLPANPELGFVEPLLQHKKTEYRTIVVWSYKIIYRVSKDQIVISRLFHTSRNPGKLKGV